MKKVTFLRSQRKWLLGAACFGAALLILPVQNRIDAQMNRTTIDPDILYFSSPRMVKAMALGYDDLVADVYWMRAIQYYGRREEAARRRVPYKNLAALLDIVTTLDSEDAGCLSGREHFFRGAGAHGCREASGVRSAAGERNLAVAAGMATSIRQRLCLLPLFEGL